jgi:hypothetical protein
VDGLALSSIISKSSMKPKPYFHGLQDFEELSTEQLTDIVAWGEVMARGTRRTAQSIQLPLPSLAFVAESAQNEPVLAAESDQDNAVGVEVPIEAETDSEEEEEIAVEEAVPDTGVVVVNPDELARSIRESPETQTMRGSPPLLLGPLCR